MLRSLNLNWHSTTIKTRLILLVLVANAVSLGVGYDGLLQNQKSKAAFEAIYENRVVSTGYLKDIEAAYTVNIYGAAVKCADGLISGEEASKAVADARASIAETWPKFVARQKTDVDMQLTQAVEALKSDVDGNLDALQDVLKKGDRAAIRKYLQETWYPSADPLADQLTQLYDTLQSEGRNDFADLTAAYTRGRNVQFSIIGLGLAISLFLGWTVFWTITRSLRRVREQLHELSAGEGDLTRRLPTGRDEVGLIAQEVNGLMEKLFGLVRRVQESGIQVTSSSTQLSASSRELEATSGRADCFHQ